MRVDLHDRNVHDLACPQLFVNSAADARRPYVLCGAFAKGQGFRMCPRMLPPPSSYHLTSPCLVLDRTTSPSGSSLLAHVLGGPLLCGSPGTVVLRRLAPPGNEIGDRTGMSGTRRAANMSCKSRCRGYPLGDDPDASRAPPALVDSASVDWERNRGTPGGAAEQRPPAGLHSSSMIEHRFPLAPQPREVKRGLKEPSMYLEQPFPQVSTLAPCRLDLLDKVALCAQHKELLGLHPTPCPGSSRVS